MRLYNELVKAAANVKLIPLALMNIFFSLPFPSRYRALKVTCIMKIKWK